MTRQTIETRPNRLATLAAAVLASASVLAAPGFGPEHVTVQSGAWNDPAVWDTGVVPMDAFDGSITYLKHNVTLSGSGAATNVWVGIGGSTGTLTQQGGDLECDLMLLGRSGQGFLNHWAGTTTASEIQVGWEEFGQLEFQGGTVSTGSLHMGGVLASPPQSGLGIVEIQGGEPTLTVTNDLVVGTGSEITLFPSENGAAGLKPIQVGSAEFQSGSKLLFGVEYFAQAGDAWDLVVSDTPIVGLPDFTSTSDGFANVVLDTSNPLVLRAVVTESLWPVWTDLGGASTGISGQPTLVGNELPLVEEAPVGWTLTQAPASEPVLLVVAGTSSPLGVFGGTLHAFPWDLEMLQFTDAQGEIDFSTTWPGDIPGGLDLWLQYICQDPSVIFGLTLSNAITATTGPLP